MSFFVLQILISPLLNHSGPAQSHCDIMQESSANQIEPQLAVTGSLGARKVNLTDSQSPPSAPI